MAFPFNQFSRFSLQGDPAYVIADALDPVQAIADALDPVQAFADAQARADAEDQAYEQELADFHAANIIDNFNSPPNSPRPSQAVLYRIVERRALEKKMAEAEEQRAMNERRIANSCNDVEYKRLKFDDHDDNNDSNDRALSQSLN